MIFGGKRFAHGTDLMTEPRFRETIEFSAALGLPDTLQRG